MRRLFVFSVALMCASYAHAGTTFCKNDEQCVADYFCESSVHFCQKCLHCEDLKRNAPAYASPTSCIKSVVECGSCLQGFIMGNRAKVNGECVTPDDSTSERSLPVYIWFIIAFGILGVFIAVIIIIVLRRKDILRISTATWLRSSCASTDINASAPEAPPPYNPYSPVRPDSPFALPDVAYSPPADQDSSRPFIKRAPSSLPQTAREAAGNQNARVYNPPSYVRIDPQSPVSPLREEDSENWPSIHNEDTTPHDWTPTTSTNDANGNTTESEVTVVAESTSDEAIASNDLPMLLAAARDTTLVAPPAKKLRTQQDSNNNGNRGGSSSDFSDGGAGIGMSSPRASGGPSIYFNIFKFNSTKL